ncbi:hypothetical protein C8F01DRAFT_1151651 [Mycena amicta]|nr:hypothetical protein C8F01DRAFT_1151651 [Mycena amicta]
MASGTPSLPLNSHRGSPASLSTSTTQTPPAHPQARRQDRATFLGQVFDMVSKRPANDPTLSWSKDGKSIVIWNQAKFEQDVLPAFFPMQKKLRTFLRAMQSFAFKRSTDKNGGISLTHSALSRQSPRADFLAARPKAESATKEDSKPAVVDSGKNIARTKTSSTSQNHASATLPSRSTLPTETTGASAFQLAAMYCTTCCRLPPAWTQYHYPDVGGVLRCNWCAQGYYLPSTSHVASVTATPPQNHDQSGGFSAPMATPPASTSSQPPKSKRKWEPVNADIPHTDVDRETKRIKAIDEKNYDSATSASSAPNSLVSTASPNLDQSLTTTSMPNTRPVRSISPQSVATAPTGIPPLPSPPSSESCATACNQITGDRSGLVRKPSHSQSPPVTSEPTVMLDSDVLSFSGRKVIFTTSNMIANDVTPSTSESPRPKIPSPILSPRGEDSSLIRQKKLLRVRFADEDMNMHGSSSTNTPTIARTTSQAHQRRRYECHHDGCGISYSQPAALQWHQARLGHVG